MTSPNRVKWIEHGSFFFAQQHPDGSWEFANQDIGEVRSFPINPTPELIMTAESLLAQQAPQESFPYPIPATSFPPPDHLPLKVKPL